MSGKVVTGKLGTGKTLVSVSEIKEHVSKGLRVATNLDLYMEQLVSYKNKTSVIRIPDKPRSTDFYALGTGDGRPHDDLVYNEDEFGLIVLDECATWLNSRDWNDKDRKELVEYMIHARKYRWHVIFIVQNVEAIDKQLKKSLFEYVVICKRLNKMPVPLINGISKLLFSYPVTLPDVHLGITKLGTEQHAPIVDRKFYRCHDLYAAYRTGQVFANDELITNDGELIDMRAPYTMLSAWHLKGRYEPSLKDKIILIVKKLILKIDNKIGGTMTARAQPRVGIVPSYVVKDLTATFEKQEINIW